MSIQTVSDMSMQFFYIHDAHDIVEAHCYFVDIGRTDCEQIRSRINNNDCQLRTELKKLQCEIGYIANTGQWCCVMKSGCINDQ